MRLRIARNFTVTLLLSWLLALAAVASAQPVSLIIHPDSLEVLSEASSDARYPVVAAQGERAVAAWTGNLEGRRRVFAVQHIRGDWTFAHPVDEPAKGNCREPAAAYADDGTGALAWIEESAEVCRLVYKPLGERPREISRSLVRMETPSLTFNAESRPILAWTEGGAGRFSIMTAWMTETGDWIKTPLSPAKDSYDILPTVIGGDTPRVYWYSLQERNFRIVSAELRLGTWRPAEPDMAVALPANRFPLLYDTGTELGPGAVWVEPLSEGEIVLTADPRREAEDFVRRLPGAPNVRQLEPDAASSRHDASYAWREEAPDSGAVIRVLHADKPFRIAGVPHPSQPRLADNGQGALHVLFVSDRVEGGTGQVYWVKLEAESRLR